jgi:hypothetical protein
LFDERDGSRQQGAGSTLGYRPWSGGCGHWRLVGQPESREIGVVQRRIEDRPHAGVDVSDNVDVGLAGHRHGYRVSTGS